MSAQPFRDVAADEWAHHYISEHHLDLIPLAVGEKKPATQTGDDHSEFAVTSVADVSRWWPRYGIGVAGRRNRLAAIDIDGPIGWAKLRELEDEHGALPATWELSSNRTDEHRATFVYAWPDDVDVATSNAVDGCDKLEVKAGSSLFVLPPSKHPTGTTYSWAEGSGCCDLPRATLPQWVVDVVTKPKAPTVTATADRYEWRTVCPLAAASLKTMIANVAHRGEGERHIPLRNAAVAAGGYVAAGCLDRLETEAQLIGAGIASGHDDGDIEHIAQDVQGGIEAGIEKGADPDHLAKHEQPPPPREDGPQPEPKRDRILDGLAFLDAFENPRPAIFGEGSDVLWPAGEPLLVVAKPGVGKTTFAHNLIVCLTRDDGGEVLGYPVRALDKPILYIAADRPAQAARSLARFREGNEAAFQNRLKVWWGPLPFDLGRDDDPGQLATLVNEHGCGSAILDSLSNVASDVASDEGGGRINRAMSETIATGHEVLTLHHQRKSTGENKKPQGLQDVYGSVWITAGAGSVLYLHGEPGDPFLTLMHLKSPTGEVGPLALHLDEHGRFHVDSDRDPLAVLRQHPKGIVASRLAEIVKGSKPNKNDIEKARRKLEYFAKHGYAVRQADRIDGGGGTQSGHVYLPHDGRLTVAS